MFFFLCFCLCRYVSVPFGILFSHCWKYQISASQKAVLSIYSALILTSHDGFFLQRFRILFLHCRNNYHATIHKISGFRGNFSIRFWRQYVSLYVLIAAIVSLLLTSDRKSSSCHGILFIFWGLKFIKWNKTTNRSVFHWFLLKLSGKCKIGKQRKKQRENHWFNTLVKLTKHMPFKWQFKNSATKWIANYLI